MAEVLSRARQIAAKKAAPQKTSHGFAKGSRPGVVTQSGKNLFKDGKLVGSYADEAAAGQAAQEFTSPTGQGRIQNVLGDQGGQTYRQLRRVDKGVQTPGGANTEGVARAMASKGMTSVINDQGQITGSRSGAQVAGQKGGFKSVLTESELAAREKRAGTRPNVPQGQYIAPIGEMYQKSAPVLQEPEKFKAKLEELAKERGIDLNTAPASTLQVLNEAANTQVYGQENPTFSTDAITMTQKAQEKSIAAENSRMGLKEQLQPSGAVTSSSSAQNLVNEHVAKLETALAEGASRFGETVDTIMPNSDVTDPDLIAEAEASGKAAQDLLEERRQFLMDQYEQQTARLKEIYAGKEADFQEQARIQMAQSVASLARMGALGTTSAGVQYLGDQDRADRAKLLSFAAEEAAAQQTAYDAFQEGDFNLAEKMIQTAKDTRTEVESIKDKVLARQVTIENLKNARAETASKTVDNLARAGYTEEDLPQGYLDSLDRQQGYPSGTSAGLMKIAQKEKEAESETKNLEQMKTLQDVLASMPPDQSIDIGGHRYYGEKNEFAFKGTEIDESTGSVLSIFVNEKTGETRINKQNNVLKPNVKYARVETKNADGSSSWWYVPEDPSQGGAIPVTGEKQGGAQGVNESAIQQQFHEGMSWNNPEDRAELEAQGLTEKDLWCLRWIGNLDKRGQDLMNEVGDSLEEKRASVEKNIGYGEGQRKPMAGDYILTDEDSENGHLAHAFSHSSFVCINKIF